MGTMVRGGQGGCVVTSTAWHEACLRPDTDVPIFDPKGLRLCAELCCMEGSGMWKGQRSSSRHLAQEGIICSTSHPIK